MGRGVDAVIGVHLERRRADRGGVFRDTWGRGGIGEAAVEAGGDVRDGVG